MRILFVSNLYPPCELGGMEQLCQEAVERLRGRGHTCHVLTSRYGVRDHTMPEEGITREFHLQADIDYYRPLDFFLRRPGQERANRRALRQTLDAFEPDVVFIWGMWNLSSQVAYWAEQWMPGRVAYAIASYWLIEPDAHKAYWQSPGNRPWAEMLKSAVRWLALNEVARKRKGHSLELRQVACVSRHVRRKLLDSSALPHGARVIYNGVDPELFVRAQETSPPSQGKALRLIYVGGMLRHKGVHTIIEALGLLHQRGVVDGLHLTLVGGGHPDYETQLKRRVVELTLRDRVTFHGRVPREQVPSLLTNSDIFLFPSVWEEPIARSVMEAMAAGLAVVGTPVGGQREMLEDGQNALLFPPEDAERLAECILRLRGDPALRERLAEAGRRTVLERFTLERMVDEMEAWLEKIVE
ncbi:MAG: glycosyltransferase family 4 protein [bacterium]